MRSHHYIREGEQALGNGALQNTLGHILEYEISFFFINIQSYCKELMITDSGDQVLCLDQAAAEVFTRITPSFILAIVSSLMMCLVSSVSGQ